MRVLASSTRTNNSTTSEKRSRAVVFAVAERLENRLLKEEGVNNERLHRDVNCEPRAQDGLEASTARLALWVRKL